MPLKTKFKNKMNYNHVLASMLLATLLFIQGCAGVFIGAAGGAIMAAHDRRDAAIILKDEKIESIATDKIYSDLKLRKKIHVNITSYNTVVLVTGEVHNQELRDYAISIIRDIDGIKRVHNELEIRGLTSFGSRSADSLITSKVKSEMIGDKNLDASRIKVVTENQSVFLMGLVTDKEAEMAVNVARNVKDVKRVVKIFEIIPEPISKPVASSPETTTPSATSTKKKWD